MTIPAPPARRVGQIVLVVIQALVSALALALPGVAMQQLDGSVETTRIAALPFVQPVARLQDVAGIVAAVTIVIALVVPAVLLIRALGARRAGRFDRALAIVTAIGALLWGLFLLAAAFSTAQPWVAPGAFWLPVSGTLALVGVSTVMSPLIPRRDGAGQSPE